MDPTQTLTTAAQLPILRIRSEHTHTLKDGWRLSSTTVEMTFPMDRIGPYDAAETVAVYQRLAFDAGQDEAVRRNQEGHMEVAP